MILLNRYLGKAEMEGARVALGAIAPAYPPTSAGSQEAIAPHLSDQEERRDTHRKEDDAPQSALSISLAVAEIEIRLLKRRIVEIRGPPATTAK